MMTNDVLIRVDLNEIDMIRTALMKAATNPSLSHDERRALIKIRDHITGAAVDSHVES